MSKTTPTLSLLTSCCLLLTACGGSDSAGDIGSDTTDTAVISSAFRISGTVPGTLIEAFCEDGSYYSTHSEQNGTAQHPFLLNLPDNTQCRIAMSTNENDPANKVTVPLVFRNTSGTITGLISGSSTTLDLGHVALPLSRSTMRADRNGDGVEDTPAVLALNATQSRQATLTTRSNDPLDRDGDDIPNLYEDSDGDRIPDQDDPDDDNDGIHDELDNDHDNDGLPDNDLDGDGIANNHDHDDDNDGVDDEHDDDDDNDGIKDDDDFDDDNDSLDDDHDHDSDRPDADNDLDNDGLDNAIDTDDDNDGIEDSLDDDDDNDGQEDRFDDDDDNDGISDADDEDHHDSASDADENDHDDSVDDTDSKDDNADSDDSVDGIDRDDISKTDAAAVSCLISASAAGWWSSVVWQSRQANHLLFC